MAESHYIADSARDPHPSLMHASLMQVSGPVAPTGALPVSTAAGLPPHRSSVVINDSFRS